MASESPASAGLRQRLPPVVRAPPLAPAHTPHDDRSATLEQQRRRLDYLIVILVLFICALLLRRFLAKEPVY